MIWRARSALAALSAVTVTQYVDEPELRVQRRQNDVDSTCLTFGVDYQSNGTYFINSDSTSNFTFVSEFEGCNNYTASTLLVNDQTSDEYECTDVATGPDDAPQMSTCPIEKAQMESGNWTIVVVGNNGDGKPFAWQRDFSLSVAPQQTTTIADTVDITVTKTPPTSSCLNSKGEAVNTIYVTLPWWTHTVLTETLVVTPTCTVPTTAAAADPTLSFMPTKWSARNGMAIPSQPHTGLAHHKWEKTPKHGWDVETKTIMASAPITRYATVTSTPHHVRRAAPPSHTTTSISKKLTTISDVRGHPYLTNSGNWIHTATSPAQPQRTSPTSSTMSSAEGTQESYSAVTSSTQSTRTSTSRSVPRFTGTFTFTTTSPDPEAESSTSTSMSSAQITQTTPTTLRPDPYTMTFAPTPSWSAQHKQSTFTTTTSSVQSTQTSISTWMSSAQTTDTTSTTTWPDPYTMTSAYTPVWSAQNTPTTFTTTTPLVQSTQSSAFTPSSAQSTKTTSTTTSSAQSTQKTSSTTTSSAKSTQATSTTMTSSAKSSPFSTVTVTESAQSQQTSTMATTSRTSTSTTISSAQSTQTSASTTSSAQSTQESSTTISSAQSTEESTATRSSAQTSGISTVTVTTSAHSTKTPTSITSPAQSTQTSSPTTTPSAQPTQTSSPTLITSSAQMTQISSPTATVNVFATVWETFTVKHKWVYTTTTTPAASVTACQSLGGYLVDTFGWGW